MCVVSLTKEELAQMYESERQQCMEAAKNPALRDGVSHGRIALSEQVFLAFLANPNITGCGRTNDDPPYDIETETTMKDLAQLAKRTAGYFLEEASA